MKTGTAGLCVVRHAKVDATGVCYGQSNVPTVMGPIEAGTIVANQLVSLVDHTQVIFTSPWARTEPVARHVGDVLGIPVVVDARLSELSMGTWEGRRFDDIEREEPALYNHWMANWRTSGPPGGESLPVFLKRIENWWNEARHENALVVCHAGVIRALRSFHNGSDYEAEMANAVDHLNVERLGGGGRS